ncbi:DegT/DnrJ/EryC1/StrS family aminotransferase [Rhizobium leguminosarum]|uniref:GDP-perosamine synthase n=1 Tax=Rhizobium leguminosarum TaxID=384 RepID=A0A2K9YY37_RHILE|nr:DegT/DnrJ/EryC1/StrS family aminotransferase [Rhizobium leguminosarum]AUW40880.1 GDP-perosamine synthase [Rhizobium leguminosarum]
MVMRPIPISQPAIGAREEELVLEAVRSGWVSSIGKYIDAFEESFARFCDVKYAIAVSNGTTGLHLALETLNIKAGDEVVVPDLTFVATANTVAQTGAVPVLVDIDPETLCLDPASVAAAITARTKAIMPVHLYGHAADMDALQAIADEHGLAIIEDAAEAHGAEYKGRRVGGLGNCGVFSFYGNKIITTGEGGMITTNDPEFYQRARNLRDHAMSPERRYWHHERGFNYRMTNLQAALGVAQMERIDTFIQKRIDIMNWYRKSIHTDGEVRLNREMNWSRSVFWMVCLEVDWFTEKTRNDFMAAMKACGIDSRPYFCTLSSMPMYARDPLAVSKRKSDSGLCLPSFYDLTEAEVVGVADTINDLLEEMRPR